MVSRLATFLTMLALGAAASTAAQERLTLQQAVAATLTANPDLQAARAAARESDARVAEARASYLPRVDFVESWQRGNNPVYVFGSLLSQRRFTAANFALDALNDPEPLGNFRAGVMVDQPLFDASRLTAIKAAGLGRQIAATHVSEAASELALATTKAYGGLVQATANRRAAESAVAAAREDLARARHRRDAGVTTEADVLSLDVHLAQMQERHIRATSAEQVARAQLNRLMGTALDRDVQVEEPAAAEVAALPNVQESEEEALRQRPAARRADFQQALAGVHRTAARSAFLPQVSVQAFYDVNGSRFTDRASSWMVAGQLRWNLFAGFGDAARLRAASAAQARAVAERESLLASLRLEVRTARAELDGALAREAVGRTAVRQARESQRIIRDRYESGMAGITEVLRAATAVLDAELQRTSAVVDVMVSRAALDRALGRAQ